ncbi:MAG: bacteriocin transport accessory protein [Oscillospiraceae bacterium]|nr:bacteriocin transport accessory protein [Oscillospiraceae bacterium]
MKKLLAILLAALLTLSLAACSGNKPNEDDKSSSDPDTSSEAPAAVAESALEILTKVWNNYKEEDKFAIAGGDYTEENMKTDEPGVFSLEDADVLDNTIAFPAASVDKIDDAAAIRHMMNTNTFTCGAYHVKDAGTVKDVAEEVHNNIKNRQWICGFPEKLVIVTVGDYIVAFFGAEDLVNVFTANLTAVYASAETVCDEPIM